MRGGVRQVSQRISGPFRDYAPDLSMLNKPEGPNIGPGVQLTCIACRPRTRQ